MDMNEIERVMQRVENGQDPRAMSCGEKIAVALIWNRFDLIPDVYRHPLGAIDRLGDEWLRMCIEYRKKRQ
jgi:hypothetical protein